jgi:hypothetical protein
MTSMEGKTLDLAHGKKYRQHLDGSDAAMHLTMLATGDFLQ